eukprot:c20056_g1_i2.p1 GENE.c20056_g1_i2~~c20056_g1_i2.p1  ORF type:complete len:598 (+),score=142.65 c20056_g1_i2:24-1817(+)
MDMDDDGKPRLRPGSPNWTRRIIAFVLILGCLCFVRVEVDGGGLNLRIGQPKDGAGINPHGSFDSDLVATKIAAPDDQQVVVAVSDEPQSVEEVEESAADDNDSNHDQPEHTGAGHRPERYSVSAHSKRPISAVSKSRRDSVKAAMQHAWKGYREYAWGMDEFHPVSKSSSNDFGMGLTIVDSLDTLWIMGMAEEFEEATEWVSTKLNFVGLQKRVSVFETFIRVVGGLLSAYELSAKPMFLEKCVELTDILVHAFKSESGLPFSTLDLESLSTSNHGWASGGTVVAEAGTVQIELRALSHFTGDPKYAAIGDKAFWALDDAPNKMFNALYPFYITNSASPRFLTKNIGIGALADSFYEYMLKAFIQTKGTQPRFRKMYVASSKAIIDHLVRTTNDGVVYVVDYNGRSEVKKMDHLACFAGGMFALGAKYLKDLPDADHHMQIGKGLTETCYKGYQDQATKIGPEVMTFVTNPHAASADKTLVVPFQRNTNYILRPETVEALFYMYRLTGDEKYQDMGWEIFQALEKNCKVASGGYSGIRDVTRSNGMMTDKMESFFLAETLKYLYLLFSPTDLISLDEFVFNTEAHPLRIFTPTVF